jgi:hypothetical protein
MRVYGLSYRDTMSLPIEVFWNLSGTVPRLLAGERREALELMTASAHNPEAATELYLSLDQAAPNPVKMSIEGRIEATSVRDEVGFNELRSMAR